MTEHTIKHTGAHVQPYADAFRIGQKAVAKIRLEMANAAMADAAPDIITTGYMNPEWRAMRLRQLREARADYERAKAVLS